MESHAARQAELFCEGLEVGLGRALAIDLKLSVRHLVGNFCKGTNGDVQSLVEVEGSGICDQEFSIAVPVSTRMKEPNIRIIENGRAFVATHGSGKQSLLPQMICDNHMVGKGD